MRVKSASQLANLFIYPPSDFKPATAKWMGYQAEAKGGKASKGIKGRTGRPEGLFIFGEVGFT